MATEERKSNRSLELSSIGCLLILMSMTVPLLIGQCKSKNHKPEQEQERDVPDYEIIEAESLCASNTVYLACDQFGLTWDRDRNAPLLCKFWLNAYTRSDICMHWNVTNDERCASATWDYRKYPYPIDTNYEIIAPLAPKTMFYLSDDAERSTMAIPMPQDFWVEWSMICKDFFSYLTKVNPAADYAVCIGPIFSRYASKACNRPVATSFFIAIWGKGLKHSIDEKKRTKVEEVPVSLGVILSRDKTTNLPSFDYVTILEIEKRAKVKLFDGLMKDEEKGYDRRRYLDLYGDHPLTTREIEEFRKEEEKRKKMEEKGLMYVPPKKEESPKQPAWTGRFSEFSKEELRKRRKEKLPCSETTIEVKRFTQDIFK